VKSSVHLVSLGCAKNLVDSEVMLGVLLKAGHTIEPVQSEADVVIVNTCGFVEGSKQESIDAILEANQLRTIKPGQKLLVAGCMAQRYVQELQKELPEVSAFIGINEVPKIDTILEAVRNGLPVPHPAQTSPLDKHDHDHDHGTKQDGPQNLVTRKPTYLYDFNTPRYQLTPNHFAYLKIGEGCNHPCAFCSIPIMRGRHRSRTLDDVEAEARALVKKGVKELLLISQDTTYFGKDLGVADGLSQLLTRLNAIEGDFWIRILYTHPAHWNERLMETIAASPKVCKYIDIPLQHIDGNMLTRMRRETTREHIENVISRMRTIVPNITIRTTFIVGFPGETEPQFQSLLEFVNQVRFERLGIFEYSQEEGTVAGRMEQQVNPKIKKRRRKLLMEAQQKISTEIMKSKIGQTLRVLVENKGSSWVGRTESDAPDIDGRVLLRGTNWQVGEFQQAKIIDSTEYDLIAERA
jgi:ribosomal protein S12 methylthiotransferase